MIVSSQIEGTQTTLPDLYAYEAAQLSLFGRAPDVREVHNYVRALEYGMERIGTLPLSLRLIREVHGQLMDGVRGQHQTPGEFRHSQNWIGAPGCMLNDATYVPPPVSEMHQVLDAFERYLYTDSPRLPLIRLGLIHYQFEAIHPFLDGNGRIGRLLTVLLLCTWDLLPQPLLYLSAYFEAHRQEYYDLLLGVSQRGMWEAWLRFFLRGIVEQSHDAIQRAAQLQALREQYRVHIQKQRTAARLLDVVDLLFAHPVVSVPQIAELLGTSQQSASRYVNSLEAEGVLKEITGQARNRVYLAQKVLSAIESPLSQSGLSQNRR